MAPDRAGEAQLAELVAKRQLQRLQGARQGAPALLERADQLLASSTSLLTADPATALVVAYDAAKHAGMALLAAQDLRPTSAGGHLAIEKALNAQFPKDFARFRPLRRRRNELDCPSGAEDSADTAEAQRALASATRMVKAAHHLYGTIFSPPHHD